MNEHPLDAELDAGPAFSIWTDLDTDPPRVGVAGELDLATCAPLRDALALACDKSAHCVSLDLRLVSFIGSTGIREIARALGRTDQIRIQAPSPAVRRVFEMVNLGPRVVVIDDD